MIYIFCMLMVSFSSFQSCLYSLRALLRINTILLFGLYHRLHHDILSNVHIVDTDYLQGICSDTFVLDYFLELFLHPSFYLIRDSRSAELIDGILSNFRY